MLKNLFQKQSLKDTVIENGLITEEQWESMLEQSGYDADYSEAIVLSKMCGTNTSIHDAIAQYAGVQTIALRELPKISPDILREIPHQILSHDHIFPFGYNEDRSAIKLALVDPINKEIIENVAFRTNKNVEPYYASWDDVDAMLSKYFGTAVGQKAADMYVQSLPNVNMEIANEYSSDSPIITVVNSIIEQATKMKASDIHIEPLETHLRVRYRIDGALVDKISFSSQMHAAIIARLKVMGGMDIAEKRIPQDGRITFIFDNIEYDIRVSMLPTVYGEKCVMRLAVRANLQRDKKDLGLTPYDMKIFDKIFSNPNGIILVTGPTGSGKSTTLYTALSEISTEEVNVITVEDPVEANVAGVNQVQTNTRSGLTFATALRSILRQDPDIIMIGEIRDSETAEIAVQAAITGHLVVSTLHTNSSSSTIARLVNMGVESYLVADSVVGILAQRLVRKLCNKCKKEKVATDEEVEALGLKPGVKVNIYEKCGCAYCNNTGYQGRTAVYEIMDVNPDIKTLIMRNASASEIKNVAIKNGMHTLHRSAAELVLRGVTSIQEMKKVSIET